MSPGKLVVSSHCQVALSQHTDVRHCPEKHQVSAAPGQVGARSNKKCHQDCLIDNTQVQEKKGCGRRIWA